MQRLAASPRDEFRCDDDDVPHSAFLLNVRYDVYHDVLLPNHV